METLQVLILVWEAGSLGAWEGVAVAVQKQLAGEPGRASVAGEIPRANGSVLAICLWLRVSLLSVLDEAHPCYRGNLLYSGSTKVNVNLIQDPLMETEQLMSYQISGHCGLAKVT